MSTISEPQDRSKHHTAPLQGAHAHTVSLWAKVGHGQGTLRALALLINTLDNLNSASVSAF